MTTDDIRRQRAAIVAAVQETSYDELVELFEKTKRKRETFESQYPGFIYAPDVWLYAMLHDLIQFRMRPTEMHDPQKMLTTLLADDATAASEADA